MGQKGQKDRNMGKGMAAGGGATKTISNKNVPTNWILNPLKHLVS